jgi:hypothetical protein
LRSTTSLHAQSIGKSHVSSISKWGNNKSTIVALIFITIFENAVSLIDGNIELVLLVIHNSSESQLLEPIEVSWGGDFH